MTEIKLTIKINYEDGWFISTVAELPGCFSQGKTEQDALLNILEAIKAYYESLIKHGEVPA